MPHTYDTVRSVLTTSLRVPHDEIHPDATLDQLGLDSLALAELVLVLHERFGVKIDREYADPATTLTAVVDHLDALRAAGPGGAMPS
ncbi:acyl carrier protein [Streptomyces sp. NPDC091279]|uniref:acyl carrier protein n=1 Tax=unclassified Streptomyces TaxID=2593676 RepID=UPI00380FBEA8